MLVICTWLWGTKYDPSYVERLRVGVGRHLKQPHRFLCMTERNRIANFSSGIERHAIKDPELTKVQGCFARLRMFDLGWQANREITDRFVCMDLDMVVTGPLDCLFNRPGDFLILRGANASNPCPYNGSLFMARAGTHTDLWTDFSLEAVAAVPFYKFPDDQGWFWHKIPAAPGWTHADGVYAFGKPGWPKGDALPADAKLVAFPGWRDPAKFMHLDWVKRHWRL